MRNDLRNYILELGNEEVSLVVMESSFVHGNDWIGETLPMEIKKNMFYEFTSTLLKPTFWFDYPNM